MNKNPNAKLKCTLEMENIQLYNLVFFSKIGSAQIKLHY